MILSVFVFTIPYTLYMPHISRYVTTLVIMKINSLDDAVTRKKLCDL